MRPRKPYSVDGLTIWARGLRTAIRRARGYRRGEMCIDGHTIRADKRTPPGRRMHKKRGA